MSSGVISKECLFEKLTKLEETEKARATLCKQYEEVHKHFSKNNHNILSQQLFHTENGESKVKLCAVNKQTSLDKIPHPVTLKSKSKISTNSDLIGDRTKNSISQTERFIASNCKRELQKRILQYQHYVNNINKTTEKIEEKKSFPRMLEKQNSLMWQSYKAINSELVSQFDKMLINLS